MNGAEPQFERQYTVSADNSTEQGPLRSPEKPVIDGEVAAEILQRIARDKYHRSAKILRQKLNEGAITAAERREHLQKIKELARTELDNEFWWAEEIMGAYRFFGPAAIEASFEVQLPAETIPQIPFGIEELERAKELGQSLILRIDRTIDDKPLTIFEIDHRLDLERGHEKRRPPGVTSYWYEKESFYTEETPKVGWALVSNDIVPGTKEQNYLDQTIQLADYTMKLMDGDLSPEWNAAIEEFTDQISNIRALLSNYNSTQQEVMAAKILTGLKFNHMARHSAVELAYDTYVRYGIDGNRRRDNSPSGWTRTLSASGYPVLLNYDYVSIADDRFGPSSEFSSIGTGFSRMK